MNQPAKSHWKNLIVSPEDVMSSIKPGMNIFLGSGVAEPRTLMKALIESGLSNTYDLELIQLNIHGDIFSLKQLQNKNYRLKTFFSGWYASESFIAPNVDITPGRYSQIPQIVKSKRIPIDVAFIQITPPDEEGHCSLGVAVDIAREAMEQATLVVGEINTQIPFTFGDTIVSASDFDLLIKSTEPPVYFDRWPVDEIYDQISMNIAGLIEDGDCIPFYPGSLFEALAKQLVHKKHLGIHGVICTDALMELVKSGAVSNYKKTTFRGKTVASCALGTPQLLDWCERNPLLEFQSIEQMFDPVQIGRNSNFVVIFQCQEVDLFGRATFPLDEGYIASGPGMATDLITGAGISPGGRTIFALPSRNHKGESNIQLRLKELLNQFGMRESIDMIVTEYGVANLKWRPIRERAQALIDIAHPDERKCLVDQAKENKILFPDQIFLAQSAHLYPAEIATKHTLRNGLKIRFRAIKPSDEDAMRHLFYRFSDETVLRRFFFPITTMPHDKMQEYVNIDYSRELSIVALVDEADKEEIIAEARYTKNEQSGYGDVAFVVDEKYQGLGLGTYLYLMLVRLAEERGLKGFTAEILETNTGMIKVFEKGRLPMDARVQEGIYRLKITFKDSLSQAETDSK
jgi:acyl-CoA hydrolase/ribosomal protein S18 acetylase RimI-like enzyme